jgi:flagellar biosynthesis protein FlhF
MNIRTFRAESLQEGLRQIREELGDSVRILHTRQTDETSFFGLRKHKLVEITVEDAAEKEILDTSIRNKTLEQSTEQGANATRSRSEFRSDNGIKHSVMQPLTMEQLNPTVLQRSMAAKLNDTVKFADALILKPNLCRIAAFTGTAGAGKTSLIVKIAAHYQNYYKDKEKKKIALLTTDMFRIGAVEQLQKFGEMLSIPVETASEPRRVQQAIQRLSGCDLILIDTPGVSPQNKERMHFVNEMLLAAEADEVQLVLPATGSAEFLTETVRNFAALQFTALQFTALQPTGLSLTHIDEAAGMSALYSFLQNPVLKQTDLPLCFFSLGQNIAEGIEPASVARLVCLI